MALLFLGLVLIRFFEHELFSDPFLEFYSSSYSYSKAPQFDIFQVLITTSWRFVLNTILSIGIIGLAFPYKKTILFSLAFYGIAFVVLIALFWFYIADMKQEDFQTIFYIRRFLIQPIFVIILLPAFYYQKTIVKEK